MVDVFDDLDDVGEPFDDGTSANAPKDQNNFENKGAKMSTPAPSSPTGPPPKLTESQRTRPHQLLQERDDQGNVPFGLDAYDTDEEKWRADRRASKTTYRSTAKTKGTKGHGPKRPAKMDEET